MKIENFTKNFKGVNLYNNFNLNILNGKITCITGVSGIGKTTLLNGIANITNYEGSIENDKKLAYVFQDDRLIPFMSVKENLQFIGEVNEEKIDEVLKELYIFDKKNVQISKLSGGEKKRVNIARAMLTDSEICLLDEPFSSIDLPLRYKIIDSFLEEKRGNTIVVVTHDLQEAVYIADEIIVLLGKGKYKKVKIETDRKIRSPYLEENSKVVKEIYNELARTV